MISRRSLIRGLVGSLVAAPAIVRAASLMAVHAIPSARFIGLDPAGDLGATGITLQIVGLDAHGDVIVEHVPVACFMADTPVPDWATRTSWRTIESITCCRP